MLKVYFAHLIKLKHYQNTLHLHSISKIALHGHLNLSGMHSTWLFLRQNTQSQSLQPRTLQTRVVQTKLPYMEVSAPQLRL